MWLGIQLVSNTCMWVRFVLYLSVSGCRCEFLVVLFISRGGHHWRGQHSLPIPNWPSEGDGLLLSWTAAVAEMSVQPQCCSSKSLSGFATETVKEPWRISKSGRWVAWGKVCSAGAPMYLLPLSFEIAEVMCLWVQSKKNRWKSFDPIARGEKDGF